MEESLAVIAIDPEDGRLAADRIVWGSDRQGLLGFGERLPISALAAGRHRLTVRAADRWHRNGFQRIEIETFDYTGATSPAGLIADLRHALGSLDAETYADLLAPGFRFLFCPADRSTEPAIPLQWDRDEEVACARALLDRSADNHLTIDWRVGSIQRVLLGGRQRAKVEIEAIDIEASGGTWNGPITVRDAKARLLFGKPEGGQTWRVEQWQDLGGGTATSQGLLRFAVRGAGGRPRGGPGETGQITTGRSAPGPSSSGRRGPRSRRCRDGSAAWRPHGPRRYPPPASSPDP